jgi:hypothetical protein
MKGCPPSANFAAWTERLQVYDEYIAALAKYKLQTAMAERARAEKEGNVALERAKSFVIKELRTYSRLLHKVHEQQIRESTQAAERGKRAAKLLSGERLVGSIATTWSGYTWYETRALIEAPDRLLSIRLPEAAREAKCYFENRKGLTPSKPVPPTITTVLGLAAWLHERSYLPHKGTAGHAAMSQLFAAINDIAALSVREMRAALAEIKQGTFSPWRPCIALGITPSAVATRIELTGASRTKDRSTGGAHRIHKPHLMTRVATHSSPAWVGILGEHA